MSPFDDTSPPVPLGTKKLPPVSRPTGAIDQLCMAKSFFWALPSRLLLSLGLAEIDRDHSKVADAPTSRASGKEAQEISGLRSQKGSEQRSIRVHSGLSV